jgi:hypothetical protein
MEAYRGSLILAGAVLAGFLLLTVGSCMKQNDFSSCFDQVYPSIAGDSPDALKRISAAQVCTGTPRG